MHEIQASEAKTHLSRLLDEVERGETIVITRHGKAIARLVPDTERREKVLEVMREIEAIRKTVKPVSLEEILAWRHEGHNV